MTKVWQFPDGTYLSGGRARSGCYCDYYEHKTVQNMHEAMQYRFTTSDQEQTAKNSMLMNHMTGKFVEYTETSLIMTGVSIIKDAIEEWEQKDGFNNDCKSWGDYWHGALNQIKPDKKYKTNSEFSYFEEVDHEGN